jgi:hypothetical protein
MRNPPVPLGTSGYGGPDKHLIPGQVPLGFLTPFRPSGWKGYVTLLFTNLSEVPIMKKLLLLAAFGLMASPALAQSNEAYIDQQNNNNTATVSQDGYGNDVAIGQGMYEGVGFVNGPVTTFHYGSPGNEASGFADGNTATIQQVGSRNAVGMMQGAGAETNTASAYNNTTTVSQNGDRNSAAPGQGTYGGSAVGNTMDIDQSGNDNQADVGQGSRDGGYAVSNDADMDQIGNDNVAAIYQGFSATADDNYARSYQDGYDNESFIEQGWGGYAAYNEARVFQGNGGYAEDNYAEISQLGTWHTARVDQLGNDHVADVDQTGFNNDAHITQND